MIDCSRPRSVDSWVMKAPESAESRRSFSAARRWPICQ